MDRQALPTRLRVSGRSVEDLLAGRVRFLSPAQATRFEGLVSKRTARWLRESPRHEHIAGGELPTGLILPVIVGAWERYGKEGAATMCGLPSRSLLRLACESSSITFGMADKIVTGVEGASWWTDDNERRGWYFSYDRKLGAC
jgi:hypothetical protein